jgi:type IV secretory pathway TrbL component
MSPVSSNADGMEFVFELVMSVIAVNVTKNITTENNSAITALLMATLARTIFAIKLLAWSYKTCINDALFTPLVMKFCQEKKHEFASCIF